MQTVYLDFETYFAPKEKYSLKNLSTLEYIKDPRFLVQCVGIKPAGAPAKVFWYDEVEDALMSYNWDDSFVIAHNNAFDAAILAYRYNIFPWKYGCTRSMSQALFCGEKSHSLAVTAQRLNLPTRKGDDLVNAANIKYFSQELRQKIEAYCKNDVKLCQAAYEEMRPNFPTTERDLIDLTIKMWVNPTLVLNVPRAQEFLEKVKSEKQHLVQNSGVAKHILSSNKKFANWLQSKGYEVPMKTSETTGNETFAFAQNDKGFQDLQVKHPELAPVIDARLAVKSTIDETRTKRFIDHSELNDGFMPIPLRYYGAHTGRWGGSEKLNFQNLPRGGELRKCIIAPMDAMIIAADSSNIEARVLAWLANEKDLLNEFRNNEDIYANLASTIYGRPINSQDDPLERFVGKTAVLGLGYGMGWKKFQSTLAIGQGGKRHFISHTDAQNVVNTFRRERIKTVDLWRECQAAISEMIDPKGHFYIARLLKVEASGIVLPNGLKLRYPLIKIISPDDNQYFSETVFGKDETRTYGGKIVENIVQALSRQIIAEQMLMVEELVKEVNGCVVLTVHDEIVSVVPEDYVTEMEHEIIEIMRTPPSWASGLPLDAEAGSAREYSK